MTPAEVITEVRRLIQDTDVPYRNSDAVLLGFVNQTLKRMVMLRPDLFTVVADLPTVAGASVQSCPADAVRLVEIYNVKGGDVVNEVDQGTLNRSTPSWRSAAPGQPVDYMRHPRNPTQFFVSPPAASGVVLVGEYVRVPPDYAAGDEITQPTDAYFPAVVDGTVFLVESTDNESANNGRAKLFQDSFTQGLGVALQSRVVTDSEAAGVETTRRSR